MDAGTILRLGALMLAFGSLGLFLVQATNHRLRGLGWLGVAFLSGFCGALFLSMRQGPPVLSILGSDVSVVLAFALLHVAVTEMMTHRHVFSWNSVALLSALAFIDVLRMDGMVSASFRVATVSLMVALQCAFTARLLWRAARQAEKAPATFSATMLVAFAGFNVLRAGIAGGGLLHRWHFVGIFIVGGYAIYIAMGLGLAFGFFWMSTAQLSVQLEHMAGTDPLTRLYNRRTFLQACEKELGVAERKQRPFSVLMVDLDHFKNINDCFGHAIGDAALVAAVQAMQDSIRGSDVLARWGGEEFAALLPNAGLDAAHVVAERLRANVERVALPVRMEGPEGDAIVRMTVSIGLATYDVSDDMHTLMARADQNLYRAKDSGRNRVLAGARALAVTVPQT